MTLAIARFTTCESRPPCKSSGGAASLLAIGNSREPSVVSHSILALSVAASLCVGCVSTPTTQSGSTLVTPSNRSSATMIHATGTFEVQLGPLPQYNQSADAKLARMSIDKQFHGDLEATSKGEMLSAGTDVKGSAGYVNAISGGCVDRGNGLEIRPVFVQFPAKRRW